MKRLILLGIGVLFVAASASMAVVTTPYVPDLATIYGMTDIWDGADTTHIGYTVIDLGNRIRFGSTIQYNPVASDGWASVGMGYASSPPDSDLSAYDGYSLHIKNIDDDHLFVSLYMETATGNVYETAWVELANSQSTQLTLDFAAEGVVNAGQVTAIGFKIGGNMDADPIGNLDNPSNPDYLSVDVSPIPAPGAILLCSIGAGIVGWLRKRKTF